MRKNIIKCLVFALFWPYHPDDDSISLVGVQFFVKSHPVNGHNSLMCYENKFYTARRTLMECLSTNVQTTIELFEHISLEQE